MPAIFDIALVLSVLSLVFMMGRWSVNLKWNTPASETGPAPSDSEMAVTEFEIIEGLSPFGLPEATLATLRQRITTVAQLKLAINTIRIDSCRHAQEQMVSLAQAYVKEANITGRTDEIVRTIIFGQLAVSSGAAHPAFASIAGQLGAIGPELWSDLEKNVTAQLHKIQGFPIHGQDFIEPTKDGMIHVTTTRAEASYNAEFDPCRTEAERLFWVNVAAANIDSYVNVNHGLSDLCRADLLSWSKFMAAALEAKKAQEPVVVETAVNTVAVPVTEAVEVDVPVTLDSKSVR